MSHRSKGVGAMILRLIVGLALLGCARVGWAAGTWSVIPLPQKAGELYSLAAVAADAGGDLYVADDSDHQNPLQKRDAQGNWSVIATYGEAVGQVIHPRALAVDTVGNLYVAERDYPNFRIQKRDAQGNWSVIATNGSEPGQASGGITLAADAAGNLYIAEQYHDWATGTQLDRIRKRDAQGNWSVLATFGVALGQVSRPTGLAADGAGNLYVAETKDSSSGPSARIQKRDAQGHWSVIATFGTAVGQIDALSRLAADPAGNLYIAELWSRGRIQKRDAQGNWSVIATQYASGLAVDGAGDLYVWTDRIQKRDAQGKWSVIAVASVRPSLTALALDASGNLYVAGGGILKRDAQGDWSVVATAGTGPGQVGSVSGLALDMTGNLYVAERPYWTGNAWQGVGRLQQRDAQGNWSLIATQGEAPGQVTAPSGLAVDAAGSLYVADQSHGGRIQQRDAQGDWWTIAPQGASALAVDLAGNLYSAFPEWYYYGRISFAVWKWDAQGNWSKVATAGPWVTALAVDAAGNLYVDGSSDSIVSPIHKWDAQGHWSVIGQVYFSDALAVDSAGSLYVADYYGVRKYTPQP